MKRFFDPCRRQRQNLTLLAAGVLPETEKSQISTHLAACADCRTYFDQVKAVTAPLAKLAESLPQLQPSQLAQARWSRAILAAGQPGAVRRPTPAIVFREWWRDVIWPHRRIWAGLAAAWLIILAGNLSLPGHAPSLAGKSAPMSETILSWRQQERLLAELIGPAESRATVPPKSFSPQPSSRRRIEILMT